MAYGCSPEKESVRDSSTFGENIKEFTFRQFAEGTSFVLRGESAEAGQTSQTSVKNPELSLTTPAETINITTGKEGEGAFDFIPETRKINKVIFTGGVKILYKEADTGKTTMEGNCAKLTYLEEDNLLIMEGSPVLKSDGNIFSGNIIYYNFNDNTLKIEGNVNVQISTD